MQPDEHQEAMQTAFKRPDACGEGTSAREDPPQSAVSASRGIAAAA
jgi:hypothetical protein